VEFYADASNGSGPCLEVMNLSGPGLKYVGLLHLLRSGIRYAPRRRLHRTNHPPPSQGTRAARSGADCLATLMTNLGIMERARKLLGAANQCAGKQRAANGQPIGATSAEPANNTARATPRPIWMETTARVTECHHELVRNSALTPANHRCPQQTDCFLHLLRSCTNLLRRLHITHSHRTRRNLLCVLQCLEPEPEYSVTIRLHKEKPTVGSRHPQHDHPLGSLTRHRVRINRPSRVCASQQPSVFSLWIHRCLYTE
jgi:hypothetical protein